MRALTLRQPWAWAFCNTTKRVENRTWTTSYRGPLLIHAGKTIDKEDVIYLAGLTDILASTILRECEQMKGRFVAIGDLVDCLPPDAPLEDSTWANAGCYHWLVSNVRRLKTTMQRPGKLGLWTPHPKVTAAIEAELRGETP